MPQRIRKQLHLAVHYNELGLFYHFILGCKSDSAAILIVTNMVVCSVLERIHNELCDYDHTLCKYCHIDVTLHTQ